MYLHVAGPDPNEVQHAKELCESLLDNVREQYQRFKENPPQQRGYGYQQGGDRQNSYGGGSSYGGGYGSYGGAQSPAPATPGPPGASSPTDYAAQYAQYYGGADPYAAYGGYQNYVAYYQYYQQQAAQQGGAPGAAGAAAPGSAPPPPPADDAPPPPPSGSPPANGGYNSVSTTQARHELRGIVIQIPQANEEIARYHHHPECNVKQFDMCSRTLNPGMS